MKNIYFLIALFSLFYSCEKKDPEIPDVVTQVGEIFEIEFEANWSTGYHWLWMNRERIGIADSMDLEYRIGDTELEGSVGKEIWTFLATSTGDETLLFMYLPPGSNILEGEEKKEIRVLVNEPG